jgi:hypothetical protein
MTSPPPGPAQPLRDRLRAFGVPDDFAAVWNNDPLDPRTADQALARGREHTWLAAPLTDGSWLVGGTDRGSFALYDRYETLDLAANAIRHLWGAPLEPVPLDPEEQQRAAALADALAQRISSGKQVPAESLDVGTALDRYGPLSGHVLFAWRTPYPNRSQPPSDLGQPYHQLVVRKPLPGPLRSGVMRPWFEQPGGGAAVSLPRCVRWFYDAGYLDLFVAGGSAN